MTRATIMALLCLGLASPEGLCAWLCAPDASPGTSAVASHCHSADGGSGADSAPTPSPEPHDCNACGLDVDEGLLSPAVALDAKPAHVALSGPIRPASPALPAARTAAQTRLRVPPLRIHLLTSTLLI